MPVPSHAPRIRGEVERPGGEEAAQRHKCARWVLAHEEELLRYIERALLVQVALYDGRSVLLCHGRHGALDRAPNHRLRLKQRLLDEGRVGRPC